MAAVTSLNNRTWLVRSGQAFVALLAAAVAFWLILQPDDPVRQGDSEALISTEAATAVDDEDSASAIDAQAADHEATASTPCLTLDQLENHPILAQDFYRYDTVVDSGLAIAAYRGLSEQELRDLTAQGDSAAMVVLGAMSIMRANDWPIDKAVAYLLLEDPELSVFRYRRPFSPEFLSHIQEARHWYYQAAMHGRLMVLHRVGFTLELEFGGAVQLGWVDQAEYDGMSNYQKTGLHPSSVYNMLAYEIAPELKTGPFGELFSGIVPRTALQQDVIEQLAQQFRRDVIDAGLPPVSIEESTAPAMDELLSLLCESERDWLEQQREDSR